MPATPLPASRTTLNGLISNVARHDVGVLDGARRRRRRRNGVGQHHLLHFLDAGLPAEGEGLLADQLAAVVLAGIVRRRDLRAAIQLVGRHRVIHLVGADQPVIGDVTALQHGAVDERPGERRRRDAHVARHGVLAGSQVGDKRAAELVEQLFGDLGGVEAADVVGLEDGRVDHDPMLV
jgi:hypothetical protein